MNGCAVDVFLLYVRKFQFYYFQSDATLALIVGLCTK